MAKFFRRFRMNLLAENKFTKYLIYALGEITLVVIGILIALAINNHNQERITRRKEQKYLTGLRDDFQISKRKLTELIRVNRSNLNGSKKLLKLITENDQLFDEVEFSTILVTTFSSDISFNPNNSLLHEIINSGSLKDISNDKLRVQLTHWISTMEDISHQEKDLGVQRDNVLSLLRQEEYSLRTVVSLSKMNEMLDIDKAEHIESNIDLLNSKQFENNVLMFNITSWAMEAHHYNPLMEDLNLILNLLEKELYEGG